jgi:beta-xylosidase
MENGNADGLSSASMHLSSKKLLTAAAALGLALAWWLAAQAESGPVAQGPTRGEWGDQGDGTFANPILPGDFSDLDAIRSGNDYYAITSTLQYSPGMAVLHSKDLVNWRIVGHVVDALTRIGPELNWDRMNRAGRGIWAGSIRYRSGKYWVYFTTPDEGIFMSTATDPAGPWKAVTAVWRTAGWDDPCPFWDDDGKAYLVLTHFADEPANGKKYNIHLLELTPDGERLVAQSDRIIHQSRGSEANKLYKVDGRYFHYFSEVHGEGRVAMMERAGSLNGPWEIRQLNHVDRTLDKEPNQGGLIQLPSGAWYFFSHQGTGDWEGRAAVLLPVTWIEGWPILGRAGADGIGNMVWLAAKPIPGGAITSPAVSDEFNANALDPAWEWNYQPRADMWSLRERPGFLRLRAFAPLRTGEFFTTGNMLTQRAYRTKRNQVTVKLDLSGMADGEESGIGHYGKTYCTLAVVQSGAKRALSCNLNGQRTNGPAIEHPTLWLRTTWGFDGISQYSYSLDGSEFHAFGETYPLTWGSYRGDRIAIFTNNPKRSQGCLDVDSFRYEIAR